MAVVSSTVNSGELATATQYNNLRTDAVGSTGHDHGSGEGNVTISATAFDGAATVSAAWTFSAAMTHSADIILQDDIDLALGTGSDALMRWSDADADNHSFVIALGDSNQGLHITDAGAVATDWDITATTHPNVYIHSNTSPADNHLRLGDHDGTTAYVDVVGGTTLALEIAGNTEATITASGFNLPADSDLLFTGTTGTNDINLVDSVADALSIVRGSTDMVVFNTSTPRITFTPATTFTGTITGPSGTWDSGGMDIASGDSYAIDGTDVLVAATLGSGVTASSLTSLGVQAEDLDMGGFDIDNAGFLILNAATAPANTEVYAVNDNTGDLTLNALSGKTVNLAIAGTDELVLSASALSVGNGAVSTSALNILTASADVIDVESTVGAALGPTMRVHHNSASPGDGDTAFRLDVTEDDSGGTERVIVQVNHLFDDVTSTTMDSSMTFWVMNNRNAGDASTGASLTSLGVWTDASGEAEKTYEGTSEEVWGGTAGRVITDKLKALALGRYHSKGLPRGKAITERHVSPTAEAFYDAFGVGRDPRKPDADGRLIPTLAPKDMAGVALLGLQELVARVEALEGG